MNETEIRTLAILRGIPPEEAVALACRCWDVGIDLVEVPVQDDRAWKSLDAVIRAADGRPVGAGTVIDAKRARRAIAAGVDVLITPGIDKQVVSLAQVAGVPILPGVMTPTEVQHAWSIGLRAVKLFPASIVGVEHLRALIPVFPDIGFVVTGGVGPDNASAFAAAGAAGLAFGGSIEAVLDDPAPALAAASSITDPWVMQPIERMAT